MKKVQRKKNVLVLENLTLSLQKVSYLRRDPITNMRFAKLTDGSSVHLSDTEYQKISEAMELENETNQDFQSKGQRP